MITIVSETERNVMKYKIKQIIMTDAQIDEVNASQGGPVPAFYNRYMSATFAPTVEKIKNAYNDYRFVAEIEANNLDEVFAIGNGMGDQSAITRLQRMKSISVGDIIVDEDGKEVFVATFGFEEL